MRGEAGIISEVMKMDGEVVENFEKILRENESIPKEGIDNMKETARRLLEKLGGGGNKSGLLYGRVQSGKTNNMMMCIAELIDSGKYKLFIVLTSDNTSLYEQTLSRLTNGLTAVGVIGYKDISNRNVDEGGISTRLNHNGVVIVCTKNAKNLRTLNNFLNSLNAPCGIGSVIFDDEADFGSLNSKQNVQDESAVYSLIENLRNLIPGTHFIEVTATPQANLLQTPGDPRRRDFTIQIQPGEGYTGGSSLYDLLNQEVSLRHHRMIPDGDIKAITEEDDESESIPESIYKALCIFFMGGAMKNILSPEQRNFSMLVHISYKKSINQTLFDIVSKARDEISNEVFSTAPGDSNTSVKIQGILKDAYDDVQSTLVGADSISYAEALKKVSSYIDQCRPQKIISGRSKDDPKYDAFYNLLIGGDRLGRGLTVKNLTVFYYARSTGAPKVDTILQHSRVYGYRSKIADIIRIFSTERIFDYLYDVYMSDQEEWEYVESDKFEENPPVLLSMVKSRRLKPTRRQVTPTSNLLKYFPGKTYFMYHARSSHLDEIDRLLKEKPCVDEPEKIDIELATRLIDLTDSSEPEQRWNKGAVKNVVNDMYKQGMKAYLIVRRHRDIAKNYRAVLAGQKENNIWKEDGFILFMYRTSGKGEGWNGEEAWIPILRIPHGSKAYYLSQNDKVSDVGEE